MEEPLVLRRKKYLKKIVDGIEIYTPDKKSLAVVCNALRILQKSPSDYKNVQCAGYVIFVTRIISGRGWNILKQSKRLRPIWFIDKGMLKGNNGCYLASLFVHEARHVYQNVHRTTFVKVEREKDANTEQVRFLSRFGQTIFIKKLQKGLAREYWTDESSDRIKSANYFSLLHAELASRNILKIPI